MSEKEIFNHIFNVVVYFNADIMYEKKAQKSLKALQKALKDKTIELPYLTYDDIADVNKIESYSPLYDRKFEAEYNRMFKNFVSKMLNSNCSYQVDKYGAYYVEYNGNSYLAGDSSGLFSLYDYDALHQYDFTPF